MLTAAHCFFSNGVYSNDLGSYYVGTLCWDSYNCGQYEEYRLVGTITIHPQYSQITLQNDFALVTLATPVSDAIEPVNMMMVHFHLNMPLGKEINGQLDLD